METPYSLNVKKAFPCPLMQLIHLQTTGTPREKSAETHRQTSKPSTGSMGVGSGGLTSRAPSTGHHHHSINLHHRFQRSPNARKKKKKKQEPEYF